MPCDETDDCPYPGKPGYDGALEPQNIEVAWAFERYRALGAWAMAPLMDGMTAAERDAFTETIYELEMENRRLRQAYPEVRLLWDTEEK